MSADADASKVPGTVTSKVPAVTLGFWIIKIAATTLGETGGDTLSMTFNLGYLLSTLIFATALVILVACQIAAKKFHPVLYWATIIASTTAGTTLADFADRSLGIGYLGGSLLLLACVLASLALWYRSEGTVSVDTVNTPPAEPRQALVLNASAVRRRRTSETDTITTSPSRGHPAEICA